MADPLLPPDSKTKRTTADLEPNSCSKRKYLGCKQKRNDNNKRKKHTCTLLRPKMETSRAHFSATEGEDHKRGREGRIHRFFSYSYPAPIIFLPTASNISPFFPPSPAHTRSFFFLINKKDLAFLCQGEEKQAAGK